MWRITIEFDDDREPEVHEVDTVRGFYATYTDSFSTVKHIDTVRISEDET